MVCTGHHLRVLGGEGTDVIPRRWLVYNGGHRGGTGGHRESGDSRQGDRDAPAPPPAKDRDGDQDASEGQQPRRVREARTPLPGVGLPGVHLLERGQSTDLRGDLPRGGRVGPRLQVGEGDDRDHGGDAVREPLRQGDPKSAGQDDHGRCCGQLTPLPTTDRLANREEHHPRTGDHDRHDDRSDHGQELPEHPTVSFRRQARQQLGGPSSARPRRDAVAG